MNPTIGPFKPNSLVADRRNAGLSLAGGGASVSYDADAQAFFTAAGITDDTQKTAINTLVVDLKAYSVWSKLYALYPFVGGSATPHSYNLVNPALYQITWGGTITHDSSGVQGNGTTGFGNTGFNPSTNGFSTTAGGLAVYVRNNAASGYDMGSSDSAISNTTVLISRYTATTTMYGSHAQNGGFITNANADSRGLHLMQRSGGNVELYKNGSSLTSGASAASALASRNVYLCCENRGGTATDFSAHQFATAIIHNTLTAQNIADLYTAVQACQTTLGRQV